MDWVPLPTSCGHLGIKVTLLIGGIMRTVVFILYNEEHVTTKLDDLIKTVRIIMIFDASGE